MTLYDRLRSTRPETFVPAVATETDGAPSPSAARSGKAFEMRITEARGPRDTVRQHPCRNGHHLKDIEPP